MRAGGGIVRRRDEDGCVRVLLVHRPRYDDWTFPKGKAEPGESDEHCALREVFEETGFRCALEEELPSTTYVDAKGRPKLVRYWSMSVLGGAFQPTPEIDRLEWATLEEAEARLSYPRDHALLRAGG